MSKTKEKPSAKAATPPPLAPTVPTTNATSTPPVAPDVPSAGADSAPPVAPEVLSTDADSKPPMAPEAPSADAGSALPVVSEVPSTDVAGWPPVALAKISVVSKPEAFWRAGIRFTREPTIVDLAEIGLERTLVILGEPMLVVSEVAAFEWDKEART